MTENTEIQASGTTALVAPFFTPETLAQFSENLNSFEENAYQALSFFMKGKMGIVGGYSMEAASDFEILANFSKIGITMPAEESSTEEKTAFTKQFIHEASQVLTHSKILPFAKLACNAKDLGIQTLLTNKLISTAMKVTPEQFKTCNMDASKLNTAQATHAKALGILQMLPVTEICSEILSIKNDYDANFQNLADSLMGVVNVILDPISLFALTDAV